MRKRILQRFGGEVRSEAMEDAHIHAAGINRVHLQYRAPVATPES